MSPKQSRLGDAMEVQIARDSSNYSRTGSWCCSAVHVGAEQDRLHSTEEGSLTSRLSGLIQPMEL